MPSRVYTWKVEKSKELMNNIREAKRRWMIKGYARPWLSEEHAVGKLTTPTLTQVGKMVVLQTIASFQFPMELGDVPGAFLEADAMEAALTLLSSIGAALDGAAASRQRMERYVHTLRDWAADKARLPSARMRFKVMDLLDARKAGWPAA